MKLFVTLLAVLALCAPLTASAAMEGPGGSGFPSCDASRSGWMLFDGHRWWRCEYESGYGWRWW